MINKKTLLLGILSCTLFACEANHEDEIEEPVKPAYPFLSEFDFEKNIVGYGWSNVSEHKIDTLTMQIVGSDLLHRDTDAFPDPGAAVSDYYFEKEKITTFLSIDDLDANCFKSREYKYDEETGFLHCDGLTAMRDDKTRPLFKFQSLQNDTLKAIRFMGYDSYNNEIYTLAVYVRMSEERLAQKRNLYNVDYDEAIKELW